ncbi:M23 family metallopeptidase [Streptomyces acidiscabies]|uniref:M23 family metallopeptidase n=1 Tax=Streptomyces acidiscabies TaxID=42234 RepID=A0AAP6BCP5_9ACTN|nr:M23 family metallopeptidase [Streptomyces acidiscabies]MBP5938426.1 M23 family metallopeptidase [Streptomyces sp. LBUM 1476]MBZ3909526.1 M23 family metallopeptidase [Streptomyces acidiscabies]MDX2962306.1 M23 family metallopeptidase [Streptomyces acidiscabies]MDX3019758.1 M23 family metallopeptidase [Streptomyces acidiscabies]MDX3792325.1 M23 family metallopeptidase [Streptomyces acidiscabies]
MRSPRRRPLLVPVLLCAAAVLAARPTSADGHTGDGERGPGDGLGAQVAKLYEEAAAASQEYDAGRREAETQRAKAQRYEELRAEELRELGRLHEDLGRIARAQYRDGGGLPMVVRVVLDGDPDRLMRGQHVLAQANLAVGSALGKRRAVEERLAGDAARAASAWQVLERRTAELAGLKQDIERKLEEARWRLQGQAAASVAAGSCPGAIRLPRTPSSSGWVAPVESYRLSAPFGSGGARWAHRHTGQDFAVPIGTPVRAVGAGRVVRVACGDGFGVQLVISHPGGYYTQYAHLSSVAVDPGERVAAGQWIGQTGTTGNSTGPHLHFEVRVTPEMGSAVNPVPWLAERGVGLG